MNNNIKELQKRIIQFRDDRDWKQFHEIKDLLLGLDIEVSELMELFLWKNKEEIEHIEKGKIEDEVADIFVYLLYICEEYGIDLEKATWNKIKKNEQKYPVELSWGSNKKYDELDG